MAPTSSAIGAMLAWKTFSTIPPADADLTLELRLHSRKVVCFWITVIAYGKLMRRTYSGLHSVLLGLLYVAVLGSWLNAQEAPTSVSIQVKANQTTRTLKPIWNYFGYDEPNYTYAPDGKKLLGELAAMSPDRKSVV